MHVFYLLEYDIACEPKCSSNRFKSLILSAYELDKPNSDYTMFSNCNMMFVLQLPRTLILTNLGKSCCTKTRTTSPSEVSLHVIT